MDRRSLIAALAMSGLPFRALAAAPDETIPLWPGLPPGSGLAHPPPFVEDRSTSPDTHDRRIRGIVDPTLTVVRPTAPDGSAVLIIPGGGYSYVVFDFEGMATARYFAERGVTAFVLTYRLPYEGWKNGPDVPLEDAQRAMRIIRARGPSDFGIEPARTGVMGFSAGGHLAASLATKFATKTYAAVDDVDALDARPSFAALIYPVITMLPPFAHEASRVKLLGKATHALRVAYSAERAVTPNTPPTFLAAAADDPDVAPDNALMMFAHLQAAKVPAELHLFEKGGHGFGLGAPGSEAAQWPNLFLAWGTARGYFRSAPSSSAAVFLRQE
ncbi:MAG TPA: alpha/beta hydrolase [Rhizomicrobium sp.]|nr:alpha/beta hydrolase [Rhizomicrobium sp.]